MRYSNLKIGDMVKVHSCGAELDGRVGYVGNFVGAGDYIAILVWASNECLNQEMARLIPVVCLEKNSS